MFLSRARTLAVAGSDCLYVADSLLVSQNDRDFECLVCFDRLVRRAIMGLASKEKLWQVSLLLVEHLKRSGLVPGKFVYDEICSVSTVSAVVASLPHRKFFTTVPSPPAISSVRCGCFVAAKYV